MSTKKIYVRYITKNNSCTEKGKKQKIKTNKKSMTSKNKNTVTRVSTSLSSIMLNYKWIKLFNQQEFITRVNMKNINKYKQDSILYYIKETHF